jgi:hypothetical protein
MRKVAMKGRKLSERRCCDGLLWLASSASGREDFFQTYQIVVRCRKGISAAGTPETVPSIVGDSKNDCSRFTFCVTLLVIVVVPELVHKNLTSVSVLPLPYLGDVRTSCIRLFLFPNGYASHLSSTASPSLHTLQVQRSVQDAHSLSCKTSG